MSKVKTLFVCQSCGAEFPKWQGRCFECGAWSSLVETVVSTRSNSKLATLKSQRSAQEAQRLDRVEIKGVNRFSTGLSEFDRVLGGGLIPGSVILVGGEPGIGKSTLLLQIAAGAGDRVKIAEDSKKKAEGTYAKEDTVPCTLGPAALYISGEESIEQIKLRADRLALDSKKILVLPETNVDVISETIRQLVSKTTQLSNCQSVSLIIIDSIQTLETSDLTSTAGSISQVQECARRLAGIAKDINLPFILVGHITKEGAIAGPKTLEHLVDAVLYLEGERFSNFRILRGVKNRFGQTSEVGIFEMTDKGMKEVMNPSLEILSNRKEDMPGSVITVTVEGERPLLLEIQALISPTPFGLPRRTVNGIDYNRLLMLLAVLQRKAGFSFANQDVYVNVSGGFKCFEPAIDLAVCLSLVSSLKNKALPKDLVALGEVGLLGEIKKPPRFKERVKEAKRLGFSQIIGDSTMTIKEAVGRVISY